MSKKKANNKRWDNKRWKTPKEKAAHEDRLQAFIKTYKVPVQNGMLVLYKAVRSDLGSWYLRNEYGRRAEGGIYRPGAEIKCKSVAMSPNEQCGQGLHVATKRYAFNFTDAAPTILRVLVRPEDVVCVPYAWKFYPKLRVKRLYVDRIVAKNKFRTKWADQRVWIF